MLLIDALFTPVVPILKNTVKIQFKPFKNKIKILSFHAAILVKTFPCMNHFLLLILSKLGRTDGQTDMMTDRHTKISSQNSKLGVSCRLQYASPDDRDV